MFKKERRASSLLIGNFPFNFFGKKYVKYLNTVITETSLSPNKVVYLGKGAKFTKNSVILGSMMRGTKRVIQRGTLRNIAREGVCGCKVIIYRLKDN